MKLYTCINHDHHYPVGVASIVLADNREDAFKLLDKALIADGLRPYKESEYSLHEISLKDEMAIVLDNGNY